MDDGRGPNTLSCMRFNQTNSCVAVAFQKGFRIYDCDPFKLSYRSGSLGEGGPRIAQMLFNSSLVCLVGAGEEASNSPRTVRLFNTKTEQTICELNFLTTVLNVHINQKRLVVVLEEKLHVFDLETMKVMHTLDSPPNPTGVSVLSPSVQSCYLVFPCSAHKGEALVYDALNLQVLSVIRAHNNPLRLLAFNPDGDILATVSEKGTVIRVFAVPTGERLYIFRRGSYIAHVHSLSFNASSSLLCAASEGSNSIHVFALDKQASSSSPPSTTMGAAVSYLPSVLHDFVEPVRDFARVTLREDVSSESAEAFVCGFKGEDSVVVVTTGAHFYRYIIPSGGGVGKLAAEWSLLQAQHPAEEMGVILDGEELKEE